MLPNYKTIKITSLSLLFIAAMAITQVAHAQINQVNSPYSRVGLGSLQSGDFAVNRSLGGLSAAYNSPLNVNYSNPASYVNLQLTSFETAITNNHLWLANGNNETDYTGSAGLSYIALGFPTAKKLGFSVGLIPYNSASYDISTKRTSSAGTLQEYHFIGEGQNYRAYVGTGFGFGNLNIGANVAYIFGPTQERIIMDLQNVSNDVKDVQKLQEQHIGDIATNFGVQYTIDIKEDYSLTLGAAFSPEVALSAKRNTRYSRGIADYNADDFMRNEEIISETENEEGTLNIPYQLSTGISLYNTEKAWFVGADVSYQPWTQYTNFGQADDALEDNLEVNIGFSIIPNPRSLTRFFQRASYRVGAYYQTGYIAINNNKIPDYGLTLGMGLPFRKVNSKINLAAEIGQRGNINDGLIRESYLNFIAGFTLNDRWFKKRKYE